MTDTKVQVYHPFKIISSSLYCCQLHLGAQSNSGDDTDDINCGKRICSQGPNPLTPTLELENIGPFDYIHTTTTTKKHVKWHVNWA